MIAGRYIAGDSLKRIRWRKMLKRAGFYWLVILMMAPFMLPFIWMVLNSLKNEVDLLAIPPKFIFNPTLSNFQAILGDRRWPQYFMNSVIIAAGSTFVAQLLGLPAAFAIARFRQSRLANGILLARILPHVTVLLPWYVIFVLLHLADTYPAMILTHMVIALPLTVWVMIPFYEDLPSELFDAALIDGCSLRLVFLRVALPLSLPGIAVATILSFTASWNIFMLSNVVGGPRTATLPVLAYQQIATDYAFYGPMAASAIVITTPVLILTLFVQPYLVKGLTLGSTHG